jgi:hypothetical protein
MALALAAASCGGGGSSGEDEKAFIARADAICERAAGEISAYASSHAAETDEEIALAGVENLRALRSVISQLDYLQAPASLEEDVEQWLALAREQSETADQWIEALRNGDQSTIEQTTAELSEREQRADALSRTIGWSCGVQD